MSNPLDVRARVYCNLGEVISGNIEDASLIDAGLVPTTGRLTLEGMYTIDNGQPVDLAYYKGDTLARLGKRLRVITSYANPMTNTTEITMGCLLTLNAEVAPRVKTTVTSSEDPYAPNPDSPYSKFLGVPKQIRAKFIVEKYLGLLGITHDPVPLTNVFTKEQFETDTPYLQVISDLLKSETYVGYMDSRERLRFVDLSARGGLGPIFSEGNVIDMQAISPEGNYYKEVDAPYSVVTPKTIQLEVGLRA